MLSPKGVSVNASGVALPPCRIWRLGDTGSSTKLKVSIAKATLLDGGLFVSQA